MVLNWIQRLEQLRRHIGDEPAPLFHEARKLILRRCGRDRESHLRTIFEQEPFGELERLVTQTLVDVVKRAARAQPAERGLAAHGGAVQRPQLRSGR